VVLLKLGLHFLTFHLKSNHLGKLFNKVIYKRLLTFMNNKNLISKNQIGFKEKSRTADHIFTLKTIIDHIFI
jgi:hypothetical protein